MIFRQLFDATSSTYTYILASRRGAEALIIDPVLERVDQYLRVLEELDCRLVKAVDTHVHADHITGLGALRDKTRCITVMGSESSADIVSMRVHEGDSINVDGVSLDVMYTPGHTDDSYSYLMGDRVFTGDTLLIRGTGRTDFQHGDARAQYDSLFNKLLKLPVETLVFPAHDYKGETVSTIGEEIAFNPRLQVSSADEYAEIMDGLNLANPKMIDVAVPANQQIGARQADDEDGSWAMTAKDAMPLLEDTDTLLVDLREDGERTRDGVIPDSVHAPYKSIGDLVRPGGMLHYEAVQGGKQIVFYCAYGERSVLAVKTAQEAGLANVCHVIGGLGAWISEGGTLNR
jgi:glyoxylase-like metal-dependent hydrolase (beta-lactamase superfamily II)/rhodanese-related sulfurtransferase